MKDKELIERLDKVRIKYNKLPLEEAVKKAREELGGVELTHRVASFLSCIRDEDIERQRRRFQEGIER